MEITWNMVLVAMCLRGKRISTGVDIRWEPCGEGEEPGASTFVGESAGLLGIVG